MGAQASTGYATIYKTTYDSIFTPKYSELETRYTKDIRATEEAKQPELRSQLAQAYYDSPLMQQYYEQRYDDYYDGTGVLNGNNRLERDGTTVYSVTAGDILKARSSAEKIRQKWSNCSTVIALVKPFLILNSSKQHNFLRVEERVLLTLR